MKIAFLLGSGISLKAGFDNVATITQKILSGNGIFRNSNLNYYFIDSHNGLKEDENVQKIVILLNILKEEIVRYNSDNYIPNYEELYYYVRQIHDEIYGEQDNFIIFNFIQNLKHNKNIVLKSKDPLFGDFTFEVLINETINYIFSIVTQLLFQPKENINYLILFKNLYKDKRIEQTDIFTINHDTLLETYFEKNNIPFCDGLDIKKGDVKHFNINLFMSENKLNVYKLHGSVNWKRFREENQDWRGDYIAVPISNNYNPIKDAKGKNIHPIDNKAQILIGTFNKLIDYNSGIFSDLFCLFSRNMNYNNILIISGYGFGDKGINTKIVEWFYDNDINKIILIHKNPEELKENSRGAISNKWDLWLQEERLIIIKKWFEEVTWSEIKNLIK